MLLKNAEGQGIPIGEVKVIIFLRGVKDSQAEGQGVHKIECS